MCAGRKKIDTEIRNTHNIVSRGSCFLVQKAELFLKKYKYNLSDNKCDVICLSLVIRVDYVYKLLMNNQIIYLNKKQSVFWRLGGT